ncbi:protocadherin-9-like isoform X1 [Physella acuta]|uniref:protocadherin-9-like isoform X1 n=1 Tax=Physella acuta TaxID=109671 RepID=UPI0027DBADE4|nr:protocadherin-9-like isoform X1 [Physella acuta]
MGNSKPGRFFLYSMLVFSLKVPIIGSWSSRVKRSNNFTFTLNLPYADETNTFSLLENVQTKLILGLIEIQQTDPDSSLSIVCATDSEYLKIVKTNQYMYTIEVSKSLDYETQSRLYVTIACSNVEAPFSRQEKYFTINVQDVNDNAPSFSELFYLANVTEHVENNSYVTRVTATDADSGINAKIFYSIQGLDGFSISPFGINSITGEIVTNTDIDRETATNFSFLVVATDSGKPSLTSTANILITVEDINDNPPAILTKVLYIRENQPVLTEVGFIKAYDADSGKNADVEFSIINDKNSSLPPFTVNSNGLVSTTAQLDREQQSNYSIVVQASDKGFPSKTSTSTVLIQVNDENDHTLEFIRPCGANESLSWTNHSDVDSYVTVNWHEPAGDRLVFKVEATDDDIGENSDLHFNH